ncbi:MAG: cyclic lactone autoinducer peptide [Thermincola sp.]|nr:cyclic lactone autoinducer peptide [Thermincola sp.]MDT3702912.1 cyclic lactone autoinducer peptide [Thermincola sp.]
MLRRLKLTCLSTIATFALFAGFLSVQPASILLWHQPEVPEHLRDC